MTTLNMGPKPAEFPAKQAAADRGVRGPMPQQAASGAHGYDIHPQTFVRLVGCQRSDAAKYHTTPSLQRTAA
jgi:hypothetical protein